ncbi:CDP-alcohol phosphatidyltransferase family protein [Sanguibacter antarcticus]|uniref:Phosphatidylglycerophosphate synthase n=1 Tax=Sanguibacter antarcticus TaxID=372484 RepID=A0A2A9E3Q8_9MICO|nr:CDP-alcohol phosphatidyltransferase family protein [Sanguibacter antarcticus]PFG32872.1 phosphatidylglycerophosphate synthase [Sanguibacter antarcticus]
MLDTAARQVLARPLADLARLVDHPRVSPNRLTLLGLATGLASAAAAAGHLWWWALALWWFSRAMDGLDGPLARRRRAAAHTPETGAGGFLDITADFTVYGATVVGVAIGATSQHGASWLPFMAVLLAYYVNGAAFLAFSSIAERTGRQRDDGRSLSFLGGLAEGTETIIVHSLWLAFPAHADVIATLWAAVVGVSAVQRIVAGARDLA